MEYNLDIKTVEDAKVLVERLILKGDELVYPRMEGLTTRSTWIHGAQHLGGCSIETTAKKYFAKRAEVVALIMEKREAISFGQIVDPAVAGEVYHAKVMAYGEMMFSRKDYFYLFDNRGEIPIKEIL